jgi:carotenoid 1,2-hydratase
MSGPCFDQPVPPGGYAWWYIDAFSDDGRHGLTVIAFVGSVFSPYYWNARRKGDTDPENFAAINVALYGEKRRWCMTERGKAQLSRSPDHFQVGPSSLRWEGGLLKLTINERSAPFLRPVRGEITLTPRVLTDTPFELDSAGRHIWQPIAPLARVTARFDNPDLNWEGHGYCDSNYGSRMLEEDFARWNWSRGSSHGDRVVILYDMLRRDGSSSCLALSIDRSGVFTPIGTPPSAKLSPAPIWRMGRGTRCDAGGSPRILRTLEDSPFYNRSLMRTQVGGEVIEGFHESLDLDALNRLWVKSLLPFRMPRRVG